MGTQSDHLRQLFINPGQVTLSQAVDSFILVGLAGRSHNTISWYRQMLSDPVKAIGPDRTLADLDQADLLLWRSGLESRPISVATIHGYVRTVRRLIRWLYKIKALETDLSADLEFPRLPRQGKTGITDAHTSLILDAARENPRDYALIRFIEATGCRRAGAANLLLSDLDLDNPEERLARRVTIREKGNKTRVVLLNQAAMQALKDWFTVRQSTDDHVFVSINDYTHLSPAGVSAILERYCLRLGLPIGACSPHQWRHAWARRHLHKGMPISHVSQLMGHENINTTKRFYGQFDIDRLQEAYDRSEV